MPTDLHLLPPDQWPDARPPLPPPARARRGGKLATAALAIVAVGAAVGVVGIGAHLLRDHGDRRDVAVDVGAGAPLVDSSPSTTTTAPPVKDPAKAVYLITVDACGLQGTGSGFALDAHHVVTNAHVVQADAHPQLRSPTGERYVGRVIGVSGVRDDGRVDPAGPPDVAVIEVDNELPGYLRWASSAPTVGQVLSGVTFPEGVYTPTTGTVVASEAQGFEIRGDFDHGSSGGAVLAVEGGVAGIVTGGSEGGGRAFAFGATVLRPAVDAILAGPAPASDTCSSQG